MTESRRRALLAVAAAAIAAAMGVSPLRARESSRGGTFLPLGWDAKGMSLGGAAAVLVRSEESAYWNPANLVYLERGGVGVGSVNLVEGLPSRYSTFAAGLGIGEARLAPDTTYLWHRFALALSASQLGLELAGGSGWSEGTLAISAAYAITAYSSAGITVRGLKSWTDLENADAWGYAVDIGLAEHVSRHLWFALVARNVVSGITYPERTESLDPIWHIALGGRELPGRLSMEFDVVIKRTSIERLLAGAELRLVEGLFVVTGGIDTRLIEGKRTIPSFGFGTTYRFAEIFIGMSFDPLDAFGRQTRLSLGLDF